MRGFSATVSASRLLSRLAPFYGPIESTALRNSELYATRMLFHLANLAEGWLWLQLFVSMPWFVVRKAESLALIALGLGTIWIIRILLRQGRIRLCAWIFLGQSWIGTLICVLLSGGIHSSYMVLHIAIPAVSAVLLGKKAGLLAMGASASLTLLMAAAEIAGYGPLYYFPMPTGPSWMVVLLALLVTTLPVSQTVRALSDALTVAEERANRFSHDAFHDPLTGLPNRLLFLERLNHRLILNRRESGVHYAVLFLDLDRFKEVNDRLGHSEGDQLLRDVAVRLARVMRSCDTLARFGGDEFTVLLEQLEYPASAETVAERLQSSLVGTFPLGEFRIRVNASIGVVLSSPMYTHADQIIRDADSAMYRAKAAGGNRIVTFHESAIRQRARAAGSGS